MRIFFEALAHVWLCFVGGAVLLSAIAILLKLATDGKGALALVLIIAVTFFAVIVIKTGE